MPFLVTNRAGSHTTIGIYGQQAFPPELHKGWLLRVSKSRHVVQPGLSMPYMLGGGIARA